MTSQPTPPPEQSGTQTPRTDAVLLEAYTDGTLRPASVTVIKGDERYVRAEFARTLERESAALARRVEELEKAQGSHKIALRVANTEVVAGLRTILEGAQFGVGKLSANHLRWMCDELIARGIGYFPADKSGRWIGFIQGVLASVALLDVDAERDRTRPLYAAAALTPAAHGGAQDMNHVTHIKPADGKCQECGTVAELRPYGVGGKFVCFPCMKKNEPEARRRFGAMLNAGTVIIDAREALPSQNTLPTIGGGFGSGEVPMQTNAILEKCPLCGAIEVASNTPRTTYTCGSSDYDRRPETFKKGERCK